MKGEAAAAPGATSRSKADRVNSRLPKPVNTFSFKSFVYSTIVKIIYNLQIIYFQYSFSFSVYKNYFYILTIVLAADERAAIDPCKPLRESLLSQIRLNDERTIPL